MDSVRCWRSWTAKFDVRDLGGHMDTSLRGWVTILTSRVAAAEKDVEAVAVLPGGFGAKLGMSGPSFFQLPFMVVKLLRLRKGLS